MASHYATGFETGLYWKEDYTPGGPFRLSRNFVHNENEEHRKIFEENLKRYEDWHEGFKAGILFRDLRDNK